MTKAQNRKSVPGYVEAWLSGRCCHEGYVSNC